MDPDDRERECQKHVEVLYDNLETQLRDNQDDLKRADKFVSDEILLHQNIAYHENKNHLQPSLLFKDAKLLRSISDAVGEQTYTLGREMRKITTNSFVASLKRRQPRRSGNHDGVDWDALGLEAGVFFRGVPQATTLFAALEAERVTEERKQKQRRVREEFEEERPEDLEEEGDTNAKAGNVHSRARGVIKSKLEELSFDEQQNKKYVNMIEFLFDPDSFANTVSNIFNFSMFVKDGHGEISRDKNGIPAIRMQRKNLAGTPVQAVVSFTMQDYLELKRLYNVKQAMLPPVEDSNGASKRQRIDE